MRAARFHGKEDLRVEDVPEPSPGPGEVKLRNAWSGICGSDLHVYYEPAASGIDLENPHPITGATAPQILGHEFSGTVVEVGEGVTSVQVGDRAAVYPVYSCGTCVACEEGRPNVCRTIGFHGLTSHGGGMAEFTTVPADFLHTLPESVDLRMGALVEPMAVGWRAVTLSGVEAGQRALVAGAGPIGFGIWFALQARGVEDVIVSEPSESRRAAAERLGVQTVDPTARDLAEVIGERGVDVAFDAAGAAAAFASILAALKPGGRGVVVALHERPVELMPTQLVMSETVVMGSLAYQPEDFDAVIAAMADGVYDTTGWVSEIDIDDVAGVFDELRGGKRMKVLVNVP